MTITNNNFSGEVPPRIIDVEYIRCNFTQPAPLTVGPNKRGIKIFGLDLTPRTFIDCNLVNVEPPPGSAMTGCNHVIKDFKVIDDADSTEVTLPDNTIAIFDLPFDLAYGRFDPATETYDDFPAPVRNDHDRARRGP